MIPTDHTPKLAKLVWRTVSRGAGEGHPNQKHPSGKGCTRRCLTFALRHHKGADADATIATATTLGWIDQRGGRFHPGDSCPAEIGRAHV